MIVELHAKAKIGEANARDINGENIAKISVAKSDVLPREKDAKAEKRAISSKKVQAAKALE